MFQSVTDNQIDQTSGTKKNIAVNMRYGLVNDQPNLLFRRFIFEAPRPPLSSYLTKL